jgi:hypothetical protein
MGGDGAVEFFFTVLAGLGRGGLGRAWIVGQCTGRARSVGTCV